MKNDKTNDKKQTCKINLGEREYDGIGDLDLQNTQITSLPEGLSVDGIIWIYEIPCHKEKYVGCEILEDERRFRMNIETDYELTDTMSINNEQYVNRKSLFRILWEMQTDAEIVEQLFDSRDMIDFGYKIGLSKEIMLNSDWFDEYFFEVSDDE